MLFRSCKDVDKQTTKDQPKPAPTSEPATPPEPVLTTSSAPVLHKDGDIEIKSSNFTEQDVKILLIGPGESGKTTIWRQLKLNYCGGFDESEKESLKPCIQLNILTDMKNLIDFMNQSGQSVAPELSNSVDVVTSLQDDNEELIPEVASEITKLWDDPMMKINYQKATNIGIGDNADFFIENVQRIAEPSYQPSDEDLLKSRIKTTGKSDLDVMFNDIKVKLVDIGGQLCERSKWASFSEGVGYLIFVVPLSDFNQPMYEDDSILRTNDTKDLFKATANRKFENIPIFLVFNKLDMFEKKLHEYPEKFKEAYPDFEGDTNNTEECVEHVKKTFLSEINPDRSPDAPVQTITISAMENNDIHELFQTVAKKVVEDHNK